MTIVIPRRQFLVALGGAAASPIIRPLAARSQQSVMPVIGLVSSASADEEIGRMQAFRKGLGEAGYVEGRNVAIEYRSADNQFDRLPELANELVRRQVTVIVAGFNLAAARAAKAATATIPIVFLSGVDPVKSGLVASLNRPGGNLTGVINSSNEVVPKNLELLHEMLPSAKTTALLINPTNPAAEAIARSAQAAAHTMGEQLHVEHASSDHDLEIVFADLRQMRSGGLAISPDTFLTSRYAQLAGLALRDAVPTVAPFREFADAGGLMSYGGDVKDQGRQAGIYAGRILKGEKPADLPVFQATKIEFVINLKTAKALGLSIPLPLLGRADEVIE